MPLKKLVLKPGVNRENTVYTSEGGWYDCDKVRFRQGTPEKIGGWTRLSEATFLGIARSLFSWVTLGGSKYLGIGTNLKFYIESGGAYYDVTPERATVTLTNPFTTVSGSSTVTVADANGGYIDGDFVTFSGGAAVGGITVVGEFQISRNTSLNTYTIEFTSAASSSATGGGTVTAKYQINTGPETSEPLVGWGASTWGDGVWGTGGTSTDSFRTWSQANFGEDLVFGPRTGPAFFWDQSEDGLTTRAALLSGISGSTAPIIQNHILVSDINRFVFFLGTNALGTTTIDPMLIRWSDQESALNWTPTSTNQAGDLRLSRGSEIVTGIQARQEVLIWTDTALYTMKYVGAPVVWGAQLVGDNLSIASRNSAIYVNGVSYWMGVGNFYKYDGRVQTLRCDLKKHIFNDLNTEQYAQVFAGLNESFGEIWWFYCSGSSTSVDKYVIYNYDQDIWYFGTLARTAWVDSGVRDFPIASTYTNNLVNHEDGLDNNEGSSVVAIDSYISSAQFDLEDGHQFVFVHKMLPDMSFDGSTSDSPSVEMSLLPLQSAGSGFNNPLSEGGVNAASVTRTASVPVEVFTDQINVRVRGRQMAIKVQSTDTGVAWQLGSPRIDMRPDGRR